MLIQRIYPGRGRLRVFWWATCLSAVALLAGCGGASKTGTDGELISPNPARENEGAAARATSGKPALPEALATLNVRPLSEAQRRLAEQTLEQVLGKIDEPKSGAEGRTPDDVAIRAYARARMAFEQRDYSQALAQVEEAIKLDDRFGPPYELLGRLYEELGQREKMVEAMGEAVKRDPHCVTGLYVLGLEAGEQGKTDQAVEYLGRAYKVEDRAIDPGMKYLVAYQLGQALMQSGRLAAAEEAMAGYLRQEGRFDRSTTLPRQVYMASMRKDAVLMLLGDAHLRMGDAAGALKRYEQANGEQEQADAAITVRRIYANMVLGRFEAAEQLAIEALTGGEDAAASLAMAQYVAANTDQPGRFTKKLTDWYAQSQRSSRMALAVAQVMKAEEAEKFLTAHLDHSPTDMNAYRTLVKLYGADAAGWAKTAAMTTMLVAKHAENARKYVSAMLESDLGYAQWNAALEAGADAERYSAAGWYVRGMIELQARHEEAGAEAMAKSLDRDPDFMPAQAAVIEKEIREGNTQQALQMIAGSSRKDEPAMLLLKAMALSRNGDDAEAMATLGPLVEQYPQSNEYLLMLAQLQRQQHQYDEAEQTAARMLGNDATDEQAYELLFRIYEQDRPDATKFTQLLAKARATIPTSAVTWRKLARYHLMRGEMDQAEKVLRTLVSRYPKDGQGLRDLTALLVKGRRQEEAEKLLTDLLDQDSANGPALDLLQQVARQTGHEDLFYQRLEKFLTRMEPSVENYVQLAGLYDRWHKPAKGIEAVNKALALKPDPGDVVPLYARLCRLYEMDKQYEKAEKAIDQAIATAGDRPALYAIKAWLLHEAKQDERAVRVMTDAIAKLPPSEANDLRLELARLYTANNQIDLAMAQIERVVAANPGNAADIYCDQAAALAAKGDATKLTEKLLLKALAANPDHVQANNNLGYQWADEGVNLARAEQMIRKAITAEPEQSAYLDSMGWVQYKQGRYDQAVLWLHRATQYPGGNDPVVQDHLADAMWRAGRRDQARKLWTDALGVLESETQRLAERAEEEEISPDHAKLLPVLREKLKMLEAGQEPALAPVPDHVVETVEPQKPAQQMQ